MTIYYYGCRCGPVGKQIQAIRNLYPDTEIINTKYDKACLSVHRDYLMANRIKTDSYPAIVVDDGNVILLSQWN